MIFIKPLDTGVGGCNDMKYNKKFLTITIILFLIFLTIASAATIKYLSFMENDTLKKMTSKENETLKKMASMETEILQARTSIESETLKEMSLRAMEDIAKKENGYLFMNSTGIARDDAYKKGGGIYEIEGKFTRVIEIKILEQTMNKALVQITIEVRYKDNPKTNFTNFKMFTFEKVDGLWKISNVELDV